MVKGLAEEQKSFDELKELTVLEHSLTNAHISDEFDQHRKHLVEEDYRKRFTESLFFPEIYSRQETITEAYEQTFQWIFDESGKAVRPWSNFNQWLERCEGTYWINGKAGSGKSTLMSFICTNARATASLKVWSDTKELVTPTFFFWNPGSAMQKSTIGLLRSLIYQILLEHQGLILDLVRPGSLSTSSRSTQFEFEPILAWTERRLLDTLQSLVRQELDTHRYCFFIDGLDEFSGSQDALVELIRNLVQAPNVKVCLSSRPYPSFTEAFGPSAMLNLQDLTKADIELYITKKLQSEPRVRSLVVENSDWASRIQSEIVRKAEGVFLWVELAVKDQIEGLKNEDSLRQLEERLELLPNEIEGLYAHMLNRINKAYLKEAASYFQMVFQLRRSLSLFDIALAMYERTDGIFPPSSHVSLQDVVSRCETVRKRLPTICAGLLEIHYSQYSEYEEEESCSQSNFSGSIPKHAETSHLDPPQWAGFLHHGPDDLQEQDNSPIRQQESFPLEEIIQFYCDRIEVQFLHRTAADFLEYNSQGQEFLKVNTPQDFKPYKAYIDGRLAQLIVLPPPKDSVRPLRLYREEACNIMAAARDLEWENRMANVVLLDKVDRITAIVDQQYERYSPGSHWCTRWGGLAPTTPEPSRRSSLSSLASEVSFHTVDSKPELRNDNDPIMVPIRPTDFLSFAANYGLYRYVQYIVDSRPHGTQPVAVSNILYCTVSLNSEWEFRKRDYIRGRIFETALKLIATLLKRGANPNIGAPTSSWTGFLRIMYKMKSRLEDISLWERSSESWAIATRVFLESGANVHETVRFLSELELNKERISTILGIKSPDSRRYSYTLELSPLSILQQCFDQSPELTEMQEFCKARCAHSVCICRVKPRDPASHSLDGVCGEYDLSNHQAQMIRKEFGYFISW